LAEKNFAGRLDSINQVEPIALLDTLTIPDIEKIRIGAAWPGYGNDLLTATRITADT
jgi:hypothetical protein